MLSPVVNAKGFYLLMCSIEIKPLSHSPVHCWFTVRDNVEIIC